MPAAFVPSLRRLLAAVLVLMLAACASFGEPSTRKECRKNEAMQECL